jgi:hypothetical protein
LEEELKKSSTDLINEKIKSQGYQNELSSFMKKLDDAQNDSLDHLKTIEVTREEVNRLKNVEKELNEQLVTIKIDLEKVRKE